MTIEVEEAAILMLQLLHRKIETKSGAELAGGLSVHFTMRECVLLVTMDLPDGRYSPDSRWDAIQRGIEERDRRASTGLKIVGSALETVEHLVAELVQLNEIL